MNFPVNIIPEILNIVAPVFICSGIGFIWARMGFIFETSFVTRLVANIGFPCLIFSVMSKTQMTEQIFGAMGLAVLISVFVFFVLGALLLRILHLEQSTYLPSLALANTGNMGVPLSLFAFGSLGLAYGFAYFWLQIIIIFSVGNAFAAKTINIKALLRVPLIWAVGMAFIFKHFNLVLPSGLAQTIKLLGDFSIPLCLITMGASLAGLKVRSLKRSLILSIFRLTVGFAVGIILSEFLGFQGVARGVLIIQCAMPSAVLNYLLAEIHQNQPHEIAGVVLISTLCSFITLPALLWYVM